jgi:class 3 adenylate cyclase
MAVNPSAFLRLTQMIHDIDVRSVLPAIHVPTLVIQRLGDRITPPCHGRYLAAHIAGARYFEQPGDHSLRFAASGDNDALCAEIAGFLTTTSHPGEPDRVLATILHAKPVGITVVHPPQRLPRLGQQKATAREASTQDLIRAHRGRLIKNGANGLLATFDAPGQAIRCAAAVVADAAAAGIEIQAGIHTGEIDLVGEDIAGDSVRITEGVATQAQAAEILVSRTVKDLVAGTGITFAERGSQVPNGPPEPWPLFAVTGFAPTSR